MEGHPEIASLGKIFDVKKVISLFFLKLPGFKSSGPSRGHQTDPLSLLFLGVPAPEEEQDTKCYIVVCRGPSPPLRMHVWMS